MGKRKLIVEDQDISSSSFELGSAFRGEMIKMSRTGFKTK